jgi:hypothetical protein
VAFEEFDDMDEHVDRELARAYTGITAPARLSAAVLNRIRVPAPSRVPEILDAIAWAGVLSMAACVAFFVILK